MTTPTNPEPKLTSEAVEAWRQRIYPCRIYSDHVGPIVDQGVALMRAALAEIATLRQQLATADGEFTQAWASRDYWMKKAHDAEAQQAVPEAAGKADRLVKLVEWTLGQGDSDFPKRPEGGPLYWWRSELRRRLNEIVNAPPEHPAAAASWLPVGSDSNKLRDGEPPREGAAWLAWFCRMVWQHAHYVPPYDAQLACEIAGDLARTATPPTERGLLGRLRAMLVAKRDELERVVDAANDRDEPCDCEQRDLHRCRVTIREIDCLAASGG